MRLKLDENDRRNAVRLTFRVHVTILLDDGGIVFEGWSSNVSVAGIALDFDIPEQFLQQQCEVRILFPGEYSNLVIQDLKAVVIRSDEVTTGISFLRPLEWFILFPVYQSKLQSSSGTSS